MRGKVKYVTRSIWYEEQTSDHWSSETHPVRCTNTYAVLYNGDEVSIKEDEIRRCYDCQRITDNIVSRLSEDLYNEWINYEEDMDGDYWLEDNLADII